MPDYVPNLLDADAYTATTSAPVVGGQLLAVAGDNLVAPAGLSSTSVCGVAAFDATSGAVVTIFRGGIQLLVASGPVVAGDVLTAAAAGQVVTNTAATAAQFIGTAKTGAAAGAVVRVLARF